MEARNRTLTDWLTRIRTRQVQLPRFQRFEAWGSREVGALLTTVLRGLPAGALLVLDVGDKPPFAARSVVGAPEEGERVVEHLLDGQQRLTSLWRALHGDYPDRSFYVQLEPDPETGEPFTVVSRARWDQKGHRYPLWLNSPYDLWCKRMMPVEILRPGNDAEAQAWAAEAATDGSMDTDVLLEIVGQASAFRDRFARFNLPFLSLPVTTPRDTALDVFITMNTSARPLSAFDIVVAEVEAETGESLHALVADLRADVPTLSAYGEAGDLLLRSAALLQDRTWNRSSFFARDFPARLVDSYPDLVVGAQRAVQFLEDERVFDRARLPTETVLPMLIALWASAPTGGDAEGRARLLFRRFLWSAFATERYERAVNTRTREDYRALVGRMAGKEGPIPLFDGIDFPLPEAAQLVAAGWPTRRDRLARTVLAVSIRAGGLDLADGAPASRSSLADREYHHLFPVAWLRNAGTPEGQAYRALNCALVTWRTNRTIGAKAPERYLAERRDGTPLGEAEVRSRLDSHLVPFDELVAGDYDAFLAERAVLVGDAIKSLSMGKEPGYIRTPR